jgi:hypothetical protein
MRSGLVYRSAVSCTANAQHDPAAHNAEVERLYQVGKFAAATETAKRSVGISEKVWGLCAPKSQRHSTLYRVQGR